MTVDVSSAGASDKAWAEYLAAFNGLRERMLAREECRHQRVREQALYTLQTMIGGGNQMYVLPRVDYPAFYVFWGPYETVWGGPASDMIYSWAYIDGQRTYRITGRTGTTCVTDFQLFAGHFGDETMRSLGNHDISEFAVGADGSFEIIVSPTAHEGNWIRTDSDEHRCFLHVRDIFSDWDQRPTELHIEVLDRPGDTMALSEDELSLRLAKAVRMAEQNVARALGFAKRIKQIAGGVNAWGEVVAQGASATDHGASARAGYYGLLWEIGRGEALVIEGAEPRARYWGIQGYDAFWGAIDFAYHQSGLNGTQMHIDADGRWRAVLAFEDPGIPNWLDPTMAPVGQLMLRWYDGEGPPLPTVVGVPFDQVGAHLPPDTPKVTPQERAAGLDRRSHQVLRRWRRS